MDGSFHLSRLYSHTIHSLITCFWAMASRSVLCSLSQSVRRVQWTLTPIFDHSHVYRSVAPECDGFSDSFNRFRQSGSCGENVANTRTSMFRSNLFSASVIPAQAGCGSLFSSDRRTLVSPATSSGQVISYSSSALEIEDDETVRLASEIGYEVLGKYNPEGLRINPQAAFAVVQVGSHQFKVSPGDMIYTEKLKFADINDKLLLNKVLLMGSVKETIIGRPIVPEAGVLAAVEEIALDVKVIVFKKKRRKNYRRTNGHRQELTRLRILHIEGIEAPSSALDDDVEGPV